MENIIRYQVERMLLRKRRNPALVLRPATRLQQDIGLDSIDLVELAINLEHRFHIEIADAEMEAMRTVRDVLSCVELHLETATVPVTAARR
ncbi:phosphopantetheine-binding protein [Hymenobacter actinosclerus]|uniref:Acyl carrier protein n=1 Tax=Hymenobacter actinosclerus TaxID=82805 RepID=A0A1I0I0N5_9BACT|nr:phosphopantetheine-binding protein [Hymenobacter actinosclerus]SET89190.1 acyl carrier protein [Hymenobacter actinosclerus]